MLTQMHVKETVVFRGYGNRANQIICSAFEFFSILPFAKTALVEKRINGVTFEQFAE
jgi:hypothetical protein